MAESWRWSKYFLHPRETKISPDRESKELSIAGVHLYNRKSFDFLLLIGLKVTTHCPAGVHTQQNQIPNAKNQTRPMRGEKPVPKARRLREVAQHIPTWSWGWCSKLDGQFPVQDTDLTSLLFMSKLNNTTDTLRICDVSESPQEFWRMRKTNTWLKSIRDFANERAKINMFIRKRWNRNILKWKFFKKQQWYDFRSDLNFPRSRDSPERKNFAVWPGKLGQSRARLATYLKFN